MKLRVDPTACQAYGLCHEQAPSLIDLDEWGYAQIKPADVTESTVDTARAAVASCPNAALKLAS